MKLLKEHKTPRKHSTDLSMERLFTVTGCELEKAEISKYIQLTGGHIPDFFRKFFI